MFSPIPFESSGMFESLTENLNDVFRKLRGTAVISEANTRDAMREIRTALLEADVSYKVVKDFTNTCIERALGQEVLRSVAPGQQIVKIVHDELVALMGPVDHAIRFAEHPPTVIMLAGLQGSGKTTTAAKLGPATCSSAATRRCSSRRTSSAPPPCSSCACSASSSTCRSISEDGGRPPRICERSLDAAAPGELRHRDPRHRRPAPH